VLAFVALAAVEVCYFPGRDSRLHVSALRAKAVALAELTASSAAPALEFEDDAVLSEFLSKVARDRDVASVVACASAGQMIKAVGTSSGSRCRHVNKTKVEMDDAELWVATPIAAKTHPGTLLITFKTDAIVRARQQAERVALAIAAGILLLGLGVSWWTTRILARLQDLLEENRSARKRAEAASEAKSAFLANMSHEIRTPMNGVIGVTQLLERSELDDRQRGYVRTIARSGELLLAVINDILDFSKVEAGKLTITSTAFDLRALVAETCDSVHGSAERKGLKLTSVVDNDLSEHVSGDGLRLRQVLLNLLSNAIKFSERGGVSLRLRRRDSGSGDASIRFEVTDSGIGIAPAHHAALFEAFTQVDEHTTRRYGGTGLGLAICKRLVTLMQGKIGVESALGAGSTFWFELPLPASEARVASGRMPSMTASSEPGAQTRPRLLAVDDNEINRGVIEHLVQSLGYDVDLVEGGREAVERVTGGGKYAVVLMDCQMPEVDGYMATREIRAWQSRTQAAHVPIVAVTAHALEGEEAKVLAAGMDDFLPKPVRLESLRQMVRKWLPR